MAAGIAASLLNSLYYGALLCTASLYSALPAPNVHHPTGLLMARMEMLTRDLPPAVLVRGNNQPVLTFYS